MSKISNAFLNKKAFIAFLTAGDPTPQKTVEFVLALEEAGADLVEIGIPFSDPSAEGIVIQNANIRALSGGIKTDGVFEIVAKIREKSAIPLVFLTYLNPVLHYGYERFFKKCQKLGVDGIVIPDLPYEERDEIFDITQKYGVDLITLVAPTSNARIKEIASGAKGFVYAVSSMGVTGTRSAITTDLAAFVASIKRETSTKVAVGFGINTKEQALEISQIADGVIVGSAIVKIIEKYGEGAGEHLKKYVCEMKSSMKN